MQGHVRLSACNAPLSTVSLFQGPELPALGSRELELFPSDFVG
jgi:hypothetical protein